MSMKKLADAAMQELDKRMESCTSSLHPTDDEMLMAAMACRIQELEVLLRDCVNDYIIFDNGDMSECIFKAASEALMEKVK